MELKVKVASIPIHLHLVINASTMSKLLRCDEQKRGKPCTSQEPNIAKFTLNLSGLVC